MLKNLCIKDFAIIERLDLDLGPGMTAITGETGAGKSILIGALHLVLGGRAVTDVIRTGSDSAEVAASFSIPEGELRARLEPRLKEQDIPLEEEGELLIRRVVSRSGRNKTFINGTQVTAAVLGQITSGLVDITGQHEHIFLLQPDTQQELLDSFGNLGALRNEVATHYERTRQIHEELKGLKQGEQELVSREDYLRFQVKELEDVSPAPGEETRLLAERKRLAAAERLRVAAAGAEETLYSGEHAVVEMVGSTRDSLKALVDVDESLAPMAQSLDDAQSIVEDVARSLQKFLSKITVDPERLSGVEERLENIRRLCRKHGCTADALSDKLAELKKELQGITHRDERMKQLEKELTDGKKTLLALGVELSDKRKKAARKLASATLEELSSLGMGRSELQVCVEPLPARGDGSDLVLEMPDGAAPQRASARGMDRVEIRIAPNPGEEMKPLAKVASGGELSRVLLALKRVLAQRDPVPVYVFDEVDSGVGGGMGEAIGLKIRGVSQMRQAMCVTHLAQIAAHADHHLVVEKGVEGGRTVSRIRKLGEKERVEELARMLGGLTITDATRIHAKDMLRGARGAAA